MDIRCPKCSQKYHLPEEDIREESVYFICENCGHKIVVNRKRESRFSFRPFSEKLLGITDLPDAVFIAFNKKGVFSAFLFLLAWSLLAGAFLLAARSGASFFARHLFLSSLIFTIVTLAFMFSYDLLNFFLAKNCIHRIEKETSANLRELTRAPGSDIFSVAAVSVLALLIFLVIIFPVLLLKNQYGAVYAGFFHILFIILAFFIVLFMSMKRIIIAFIAGKTRKTTETAAAFFRFFAVENINVFIYMFFSRAITSVILLITGFFMVGTAALVLGSVSSMIAPDVIMHFRGLISTHAPGTIPGIQVPAGEYSDSFQAGLVFMAFWWYLVLVFIAAFIINLKQSLATVSLRIMESNPARSVPRYALLVFIAALAVAALLLVPWLTKLLGSSAVARF